MVFGLVFTEYIKGMEEKFGSMYHVRSTNHDGTSSIRFVFNGSSFHFILMKSVLNWLGLLFFLVKNILTKGSIEDDGNKFRIKYSCLNGSLSVVKTYRPDYKNDDSVNFIHSIREFKKEIRKFYYIVLLLIPAIIWTEIKSLFYCVMSKILVIVLKTINLVLTVFGKKKN